MTYETITYEKKDRIAYITLNRPRVLNALSKQLNRELHDALYDFRDDPEVWVGIITGAGDRAFSSGHDLKEDTQEGFEEEWKTSFWKQQPPTLYGTLQIWKPLIAAIHGYCLAGGLEIALACDMRIAAEDTRLGMSEVLRALVPGGACLIKLGQWASTRPDILPSSLCQTLSALHDSVPAHDLLHTKVTIEAAFGVPADLVFARHASPFRVYRAGA